MKQILQSLTTGSTEVVRLPTPQVQAGKLLVRTSRTLVSVGTERMLVEFGQANLLDKARKQPDKVRQVIDKARTDGIVTTLDAVRTKLDQPLQLGYCNVGTVIAVGKGIQGFAVGDRVVSNGPHAEVVSVPSNLCARIPDGVTDEAAAFTVVASIGLQGIRLSQPTLGECFVVTGLGLIGLLTAQLLQAQGCRVLGIDFAADKLALAQGFGIETVNLAAGEDPLAAAAAFSRNNGVDGVIITASTSSSEPVHQAAQMCRKRGRIILVGVTGLELSRADFYEKELSFQVSCSYGPGRYDPNYENKGQDYPIGFVRWTEQRNFQAVLDTLASGQLRTEALISHRYELDKADEAYALLTSGQPSLGIIIQYSDTDNDTTQQQTIQLTEQSAIQDATIPVVSCIGAGNYASRMLLPAFAQTSAEFHTLAASSGVSINQYGRKFGFQKITTDLDQVFGDRSSNTLLIATRHDSHSDLVCQALKAGKHVFVEKPLALNVSELENIKQTYADISKNSKAPLLMVGFNRRFSPYVQTAKQLLQPINEPKAFILTVNAGKIPGEHWTQDPSIGGGRIIGEACHFIDLLRFMAGHPITSWQVTTMPDSKPCPDTVSFSMTFADGSIGTVHYLSNGPKTFPKERLEVFCCEQVLQLDNYRRLTGWGWSKFRNQSTWKQDKGQQGCATAFISAIKEGQVSPIPFSELMEVSQVSIDIASAAQSK